MKHALVLAAAAIALAGCQRSIDQQFADMCAEQKSDPEAPRIGSENCASGDTIDPKTKEMIVTLYQSQSKRLKEASQ